MFQMFSGCNSYNQALPSSFNTANVTNMRNMFLNCSSYNQVLPGSFTTANVTDMRQMFDGAAAFNQALPGSFTTANVTAPTVQLPTILLTKSTTAATKPSLQPTAIASPFRNLRPMPA